MIFLHCYRARKEGDEGMVSKAELEEMITTEQAAQMLGRDKTHIAFLCRRGMLRGAKKVSRDWLIPKASVTNYQPGETGFAAVWKKRRSGKNTLKAEIQQAIEAAKRK
jgi:hypothetical protein